MTQINKFILALLLLVLAPLARAGSDPVTVETKWVTKTFSISTTGVTAATFDLGGFGAQGYAVPGGTYVQNGVDGTTYGAVVSISSATKNVVGFNYAALASGGSASLQIVQTLKTPPPLGSGVHSNGGAGFVSTAAYTSQYPASYLITAPLISTSSVITAPNNIAVSDTFQAVVTNPIYVFTGLTSAATLYFSADYGLAPIP